MTKSDSILRNMECNLTRALLCVCVLVVAGAAPAQTTAIYDIQYTTDPSGDSPLLGQTVTVEGVVTAASPYGFFISDAAGPWNAVYVFTQAVGCDVEAGDQATVTGMVSEWYGMTELTEVSSTEPVSCTITSTGNTVNVLPLTIASAAQEQYESVLVQLSSVAVVNLGSYGEWTVNDGSADLIVDDDADYLYAPALADSLDALIGTIGYAYGNWRINPRFSSDVVSDLYVMHYALFGDVVTMNDAMDVLEDHYVEVQADMIVDVSATPPAGVQIVSVNGLIFPGLIDAHNHPQYNVLDLIPFGQYFEHRDEWRSHPIYDDFNTQYYAMRDYLGSDAQSDNMWKLAEVRALAAGTTLIQGTNCYGHSSDSFGRLGIGINNVGRYPAHVYSSTFPLSYGGWADTLNEFWRRFAIHLSEGTNQTALDEFYAWHDASRLDWRTTIIHGVPLGLAEWQLMSTAGAHLVWSPKSNYVLYGATADVPGALANGVNVALAPDWTESGSRDILDELRFARQVSRDQWGDALSDQWLVESVTRNAALSLGMQHRIGQVATGYEAHLAVFPGVPNDPYAAVLDARAHDVELTVVSGRPAYGDPAIMDLFTGLENVETVDLCQRSKRLALAVDHHAIPESDRSFSQVISELQAAYDTTSPKVCEFMGLDPCASTGIFADGFETGGTAAWSSSVP